MSPTFGPAVAPFAEADRPAARWLTRGFEALVAAIEDADQNQVRQAFDFDVVIVGSGYGGAIAAAGLSGCTVNEDRSPTRPISLAILERGVEYLAGMFPSRLAEMPGHVRYSDAVSPAAAGNREGLFDIRLGSDATVLVANGVGGGSLINAGVMEAPAESVFDRRWPAQLRGRTLRHWLRLARRWLGAANNRISVQRDNAGQPLAPPPKTMALMNLSRQSAREVDLSVSLTGANNSWNVRRETCLRCGDCATGCNHEAKDSLDVGPLARAATRGARIYTGATVLRVRREPHPQAADVWCLDTVYTDTKLQRRQGCPIVLRARRVILAAGALGSTEILLRSRSDALALSPRLGQGFSTNGDMIAAAYRMHRPVNGAAQEATPPDRRSVGPTITAMVDLRRQEGLAIQEMAVPAPLRRVMDEVVTTAATIQRFTTADEGDHLDGPVEGDPLAVQSDHIDRTLVVAMFGDDGAAGAIELVEGAHDTGDGAVRIRWPALRKDALFTRQMQRLGELCQGRLEAEGAVIANPLWQPVPDVMSRFLDGWRGPPLTVHPLGGCRMADRVEEGVVDPIGRVFDAGREDQPLHHEGLVVLDGAIIPSALGINPALTITAVSLRAVRALRRQWNLRAPYPPLTPGSKPIRRPRFRTPATVEKPTATTLELRECLHGEVDFESIGRRHVAIELKAEHIASELLRTSGGRIPLTGVLRVYSEDQWDRADPRACEGDRRQAAAHSSPVAGTLVVFAREAATARARVRRARCAYLRDHGLRDAWDKVVEGVRAWRRGERDRSGQVTNWLRDLRALASRAGEVRTLQYTLKVGEPTASTDPGLAKAIPPCTTLRLIKRLTYRRRSNPWRQLMEVELEMTGAAGVGSRRPRLELEPRHFAAPDVDTPLIRITRQQDQPAALLDLISIALYVLRMVATIHLWSFRRPDAPALHQAQRLPGRLGWPVPPPEITERVVGHGSDGAPAHVRLTRYRRRTGSVPVVLIHGYSASGTTFAHPQLRPGLARFLWKEGFDVWVLDLRTSSGMPTCGLPWSFEDVARADIPAAIEHVHAATGQKVAVVAHCMGAAMFSMAIALVPPPGAAWFAARQALPQRIRCAVLSQVGPRVEMTPGNTLRAYVLRYLRYLLPYGHMDFRPSPGRGLDVLVDRLLATLPYPEREWSITYPPWAFWRRNRWLSTRRRLDALFGRVFNLENMPRRVLDHIDDFFGRIHLETVAQPIHFAARRQVTDRRGRVDLFEGEDSVKRWIFPVLSLHADDNGLADVRTQARMDEFFRFVSEEQNRLNRSTSFRGESVRQNMAGHQDTLIGSKEVQSVCFQAIRLFLEKEKA